MAADIGAVHASLWSLERRAGVLRCSATWSREGARDDALDCAGRGMALGWGVGLPGRVWSTGEPAYVAAIAQDGNFPRAGAALAAGAVAAYACPVVRDGHLVGAVDAFLERPVEPSPRAEQAIARLAAELAREDEPGAAGDVDLEAERRAAHRAAAVEFAHRALVATESERVMDDAVRLLRATLAADVTSLLTLEGEGRDRLVVRAGAGWGEGVVGSVVPASARSLAGYALLRDEPVVVEDLAAEDRFDLPAFFAQHGLASSAAVVLRGPDGPFGAIGAHSRDRRRFSVEDLGFMRVVANVLAAAILRVRVEEELRRAGALLEAIVAETTDSIYVKDAGGRVLFANAAAAISMGRTPSELLGHRPSEVRPGSTDLEPEDLAVMESGEWRTTEGEFELDGRRRWYSTTRGPYRAADGRVAGVIGISRDVTERRLGERRARVLADAGRLLATATDMERALAETARLPVPEVCDLCEVTLVGPDGVPRSVAIAAGREELADAVREIRRRFTTDPAAKEGVGAVIRTGEAVLLRTITPERIAGVAGSEAHREAVTRLELTSVMIAPLTARGRTFGAITMATVPGRAKLDEADLDLGVEMAGRAALASDNARLFAERQATIDTLQRALLPPGLPAIPGLELGAAFHAGREGLDVGGDFYDVVPSADGWMVVVGDVCGRGAEAATITAVARHSLRGAALYDSDPSSLLRSLNAVLLQQPLDLRFCTVLCAHLGPSGDGFDVRLGNGGHPGPLVSRRDGTAEVVDAPGTLIGVLPDARVGEATLHLGPGDSLVMFTDGLLDVRRAGGVVRALDLAGTVAAAAGGGAPAIASALAAEALAGAGHGGLGDDVAVLAVRVPVPEDGDG